MPLFEDLGNHRQEDPAGNTNTQKNHIFNLKKNRIPETKPFIKYNNFFKLKKLRILCRLS